MLAWLAAVLSSALAVLGAAPAVDQPVGEPSPTTVVEPAEPPADGRSPGRPVFNNPFGTPEQRYALIRHINARIDAASEGSTIRLAAYSFAMPSTAQSLIRAHERGAEVRVVVDDHSGGWRSVGNLRRVLGTDTGAGSFVRVCHASCRGRGGNQHAKFVTISHAGDAEDVVMVGSMNFTTYAASRQWQDLYTVAGDADVYAQLVKVFDEMVRDRPQPPLELAVTDDGFAADVSPVTASGVDPLLRRLGRVECRGATGGTGVHGRTMLRISMHAWNGERGIRLARRVARLARQGCDVRVLAGIGFGPRVTAILRTGGVGYRDSGRARRHTHEKLMFLSGHFGARTDASYVWTGSHNWSDRSLRNDEVILRVSGRRQVAAYHANFARIWRVAGPAKPG
jgi:phosphatidylserine/phosphatidylglycerophosphate/cardiolipin synthase-like enzyme